MLCRSTAELLQPLSSATQPVDVLHRFLLEHWLSDATGPTPTGAAPGSAERAVQPGGPDRALLGGGGGGCSHAALLRAVARAESAAN